MDKPIQQDPILELMIEINQSLSQLVTLLQKHSMTAQHYALAQRIASQIYQAYAGQPRLVLTLISLYEAPKGALLHFHKIKMVLATMLCFHQGWHANAAIPVITAALLQHSACLKLIAQLCKGQKLSTEQKKAMQLQQRSLAKSALQAKWAPLFCYALLPSHKFSHEPVAGTIISLIQRLTFHSLFSAQQPIPLYQALRYCLLHSDSWLEHQLLTPLANYLFDLGPGSAVKIKIDNVEEDSIYITGLLIGYLKKETTTIPGIEEAEFLIYRLSDETTSQSTRQFMHTKQSMLEKQLAFIKIEDYLNFCHRYAAYFYAEQAQEKLETLYLHKFQGITTIQLNSELQQILRQSDFDTIDLIKELKEQPILSQFICGLATQKNKQTTRVTDLKHAITLLGIGNIQIYIRQGLLIEYLQAQRFPGAKCALTIINLLANTLRFICQKTANPLAEHYILTIYTWLTPILCCSKFQQHALQTKQLINRSVAPTRVSMLLHHCLPKEQMQQLMLLVKQLLIPKSLQSLYKALSQESCDGLSETQKTFALTTKLAMQMSYFILHHAPQPQVIQPLLKQLNLDSSLSLTTLSTAFIGEYSIAIPLIQMNTE